MLLYLELFYVVIVFCAAIVRNKLLIIIICQGITQCYLPPGRGDIPALHYGILPHLIEGSLGTTSRHPNGMSIGAAGLAQHMLVFNTRGHTDKHRQTTLPVYNSDNRPHLMLRIAKRPNCHGWRRGVVVSGVRRMNEVNPRRARLLLGWVTVFRRVYHLGM